MNFTQFLENSSQFFQWAHAYWFFTDFAVGAPFTDNGKGAVYTYLGAKSPDTFKLEPVQVNIKAKSEWSFARS